MNCYFHGFMFFQSIHAESSIEGYPCLLAINFWYLKTFNKYSGQVKRFNSSMFNLLPLQKLNWSALENVCPLLNHECLKNWRQYVDKAAQFFVVFTEMKISLRFYLINRVLNDEKLWMHSRTRLIEKLFDFSF